MPQSPNLPAFNDQVIIGGRTIGAENFVSLPQAMMLGAYMLRTNQEFTIASADFEELVRFDGHQKPYGAEPYLAELMSAFDTMRQIVDGAYRAGAEDAQRASQ